MEYRIEHDSMGEMKVPADRLWAAQTQRSHENFEIGVGIETMPAEIIHAFEEKQQLAELVSETLSSEENHGIQVYIGDETPVKAMKDCSVVTATYELGDGMRGTIGIIGPKRMDYEHVMKTLKTLQNELDAINDKKSKEQEVE